MKELFRSTDPVRISAATSLLESEGIRCFEMDQHMSALEGSIGILPRRVMVADRDLFMAQAILRDTGLDD
ncbi:putative signal transducing protein [Paracoccus sp. NSM]|uniref:putative signal transducing protein n=1 Tax=Paracoccus sp. NSM TaxID=3457784 RepID=UPI004036D3D0